MTEIKAPLNLRIKNFILGHIHLFLVITFIALAVLLSSCNKAKAMEMPCTFDDAWVFVKEQIGASYNAQMDDVYYYLSHGTVYDVCYMSNTQYDVYIISETNHLIIPCADNSNTPTIQFRTYRYDLMTYYSNGFNSSVNTFVAIILDKSNNNAWGCYYGTGTNSSGSYRETLYSLSDNNTLINGVSNTMFYWGSSLFSDIRSNGFTGSNFSLDNVYSHGNIGFSRQSMTYAFVTKNNWEDLFPSVVEDDRLKIYTINDNTGKNVVFDLDDFDFSNYDGSSAETQNTLLNNQIVVTVDYDGTEQVYTLNSTNSDILPAYLVETPLSFFNVDSYNNVKITEVDFSRLIHYRPSEMKPDEIENYKIACEYYLKKYVEPIEKGENQFEEDLNGYKLTQSEIDDIYYTIHFSDGAGISFDDYELAPPDGYSVYTVYLKNTVANWEDFIEDWEITVKEFYYLVLGSYNTQSAVEEYISEWVVANKAALYWDVIEFEWIKEDNSSLTRTYWYYTTESGRIRSISNVLADMYIQGNDIKVNTAAIFTSIDNFETESLEFFNAQLGFNSDAIEWFRTINNSVNNGFSSVVNAINNLDFTVPDYDDTDILDKLDDIITAISNIGTSENEIDTPQECIQFYLQHENDDILDIDMDLRPAYYEGMTLYILYWFEIDDNYSDDVQRAAFKAGNPIKDTDLLITKIIVTLRNAFDTSDSHNIINSTLKDMNGRSDYYTQLFDSDYSCTEWEGYTDE